MRTIAHIKDKYNKSDVILYILAAALTSGLFAIPNTLFLYFIASDEFPFTFSEIYWLNFLIYLMLSTICNYLDERKLARKVNILEDKGTVK